MNKLIATFTFLTASFVSAEDLVTNFDTNPLHHKNKAVSDFATMAAGKILSVPKSVKTIDGKTVVHVLVAKQSCHVTVIGSESNFKVSDFKCDDSDIDKQSSIPHADVYKKYVQALVEGSVDSYIDAHCLKQVSSNGEYISNSLECSDSLNELLIKFKKENVAGSLSASIYSIESFKKKHNIL
jgi:hypothetical protein